MKFEEIIKGIKPETIIESKSREDIMVCKGVSFYWYNVKTKKEGLHVILDSTFFNYDDWEEFNEDDWNFKDNVSTPKELEPIPFDIVNENIIRLKAKILEDIRNTTSRCSDCKMPMGDKCIPPEKVEAIVERRFGF